MRQFIIIFVLIGCCVGAITASAQARIIIDDKNSPLTHQKTIATDSLAPKQNLTTLQDSLQVDTIELTLTKEDEKAIERQQKALKNAAFVPDPQRALWLALVLPGAGQIYNRKYWKLPLVYGGFLGCTYAFTWNQQMYGDYSQAYLDIMDENPETKSYMDFLPPNYSIEGREDHFKELFKNRKNRYRRWRDLSAFCFIGVYILSVVDAYVDAQLSEFDITPDLTMRLGPTVIEQERFDTQRKRQSYGIGCSLNF
jgi:hypothetical protein